MPNQKPSPPKNSEVCENLDQKIEQGDVDESLMDAVARCLGEDVMRFARSRCGDSRGDVEDISQDAMLAAQRYLSTFRGDASLRTWLYKLVLSACSRRRRGRKNDPGLHRSLEDASPPADPGDPEVVLLISERLKALEEAMEELRPQDREMLAAAEWEGLSLEQLAQRHELTVSAVKSRLFRIRRQLRETVTERFQHAGSAGAE
jgi:RNA polymerase sigma-70 factor (ECF subfamily)